MNSPTAIQMFPSGIFFDVFAPDPELIRIEDIAHHLTLQCRYSGGVRKHWSVAQHSLMVADLCPDELKLAGLLHDAAEAYLVDLPRPIKHHELMRFFRETDAAVEKVIAERFDLAWPMHPLIKDADNRILVAEAKALKHGLDGWVEHQRKWQIELRTNGDDSELVRAIRDAAPPTAEYIRDEFYMAFRKFGGS